MKRLLAVDLFVRSSSKDAKNPINMDYQYLLEGTWYNVTAYSESVDAGVSALRLDKFVASGDSLSAMIRSGAAGSSASVY